ncbi:hypothetical protein M7I_4716 [Glarea lozoyensis 74030]|uniref:Uncharacterized protein n=1 Tax=Glarea lozoyensis (strain ATCC 74030 / MF5533) TaxID=1104152 RepID=H0EPX8_GLAL7|nr:hypothetical protein M7I_4716 [Glarea lozoyensis 74030]
MLDLDLTDLRILPTQIRINPNQQTLNPPYPAGGGLAIFLTDDMIEFPNNRPPSTFIKPLKLPGAVPPTFAAVAGPSFATNPV